MPYTTLISAAELAECMRDTAPGSSSLVIVDCRHDLTNPSAGADSYAIGHIANALFVHLDSALSGQKMGVDGKFRGRHPLPERAALLETLRSLGISDSSQVVAYDAHGGMYAARLWWLLRWIGHAQVAVLDGGLAAWQAQGLPLVADLPATTKPGTLIERASLVDTVNAADILANIGTGKRIVVDARAPDRYRGENETMDPVGGHIPGATNRFFKDNLQADGRFKSADQIRGDFKQLFDDPKAAIMQCGSGVTACHNLLALEVAGLPGAALYPGSWSEWCADPANPVATSAA